ncbi:MULTISPECIES: PTS sugar transporter subunit IIA [Enterococcus]|uniref:PTS sugar transporter subunit IIA n=1 Tax=Enterococcus alishanensis TaxID=1303817 RepID=A0ABS6TDL7_9ENTE|nr:PTS sugar transporter subunit IIA [Enterococcus alishanensis]MBV7391021.1 PTS sugar transporter subunit IIA [Enterococcus alishanensis]
MFEKEFLFQTNFKDRKELFKEVSNYLVDQGYVGPEFEAALNEREENFATGLPTTPAVAIPHTDGTYVKKDTIVCIVNQNELEFNEMGGDEDDFVHPKVVFMLVLGEGETHLQQLQNLIEKIQDGVLVSEILNAENLDAFKASVEEYL